MISHVKHIQISIWYIADTPLKGGGGGVGGGGGGGGGFSPDFC